MTSVEQLGIETVVNKEEFSSNVLVKDCPIVGRSLVANRPLVPGDVVLVEEPLIKYDLKPTCRSTKSPYYSKKLWDMLNAMVHDEQEDTFQQQHVADQEQDGDADDNDDDDEDEDDQEEKDTHSDSDFCPGVPAAIIAYLDIHPPTKHFTNVKNRTPHKRDDFDFFYYPNSDIEPAWLDHKTIKLIHTLTQKVADTIPLYSHVDPYDLRSFVLKIYSNAHTVAMPRSRTMPTHSAKKARREKYKAKFGDNVTCWGQDVVDPPSTPVIALLRWGSKFAHSCSPNMFLRYEPDRNAMVFTVTRPLKQGQVLSFSYLAEDDSTVGGLVLGNTVDRRAKLQMFKFFECACERCVDWDWSRGVACNACHHPTSYRNMDGWTCFSCKAQNTDDEASFIGEREANVQQMLMGFVARIHGHRRMNESMMRMMEPYLLQLLAPPPETNETAVPKNHWTHGVIHSLLASYHLHLFPQSFGKGLAAQLGLTVKGLEEALVYIEFLNNTIRTHPKCAHVDNSPPSHGNLMATFFAGWRVLTLVIDLVMDSTENKYADAVYEKESDSDTEDSDSDREDSDGDEKESPSTTTEANNNNNTEIALTRLDQDWVTPLTKISNIVSKEWIPLVEQVFKTHQSVVVQDMISRIQSFADRIQMTKNESDQK